MNFIWLELQSIYSVTLFLSAFFSLLYIKYSIICIYHNLFTLSPVNGPLDWFQYFLLLKTVLQCESFPNSAHMREFSKSRTFFLYLLIIGFSSFVEWVSMFFAYLSLGLHVLFCFVFYWRYTHIYILKYYICRHI